MFDLTDWVDIHMSEQLPPEEETVSVFEFADDWEDYKNGATFDELLRRNNEKRRRRNMERNAGNKPIPAAALSSPEEQEALKAEMRRLNPNTRLQ